MACAVFLSLCTACVRNVDSFTKLPCATAGNLDEIHSLIIALVVECPDLHIEGG